MDGTLHPVPFWYLRHGETDWNRDGRQQGSVDIPLNETGLAQARAAAERMRGKGIRTIVASPLSRARVTAEIVAGVLGVAVEIEPEVREVSWGVEEGRGMAEWFPEWLAGTATPEGAESFATLRRRVIAGLNRSIARPPSVLVVAHGGVFRAARAAMGAEMMGRTRNAVPIWCEPPTAAGGTWMLTQHD